MLRQIDISLDKLASSLCSGWFEFNDTEARGWDIMDHYYGMAMAYIQCFAIAQERFWEPVKLQIRIGCFAEGVKWRTQFGSVRHSCRSRGGVYYQDFLLTFEEANQPPTIEFLRQTQWAYWYWKQSNYDGYLNDERMTSSLEYCHERALIPVRNYCLEYLAKSFHGWMEEFPHEKLDRSVGWTIEWLLQWGLVELQRQSTTLYALEIPFDSQQPGGGGPSFTGAAGLRSSSVVFSANGESLTQNGFQVHYYGDLMSIVDLIDSSGIPFYSLPVKMSTWGLVYMSASGGYTIIYWVVLPLDHCTTDELEFSGIIEDGVHKSFASREDEAYKSHLAKTPFVEALSNGKDSRRYVEEHPYSRLLIEFGKILEGEYERIRKAFDIEDLSVQQRAVLQTTQGSIPSFPDTTPSVESGPRHLLEGDTLDKYLATVDADGTKGLRPIDGDSLDS